MIMRVVIPAPYQVRGKLQRESSPVLDTGVGREPGTYKTGFLFSQETLDSGSSLPARSRFGIGRSGMTFSVK